MTSWGYDVTHLCERIYIIIVLSGMQPKILFHCKNAPDHVLRIPELALEWKKTYVAKK